MEAGSLKNRLSKKNLSKSNCNIIFLCFQKLSSKKRNYILLRKAIFLYWFFHWCFDVKTRLGKTSEVVKILILMAAVFHNVEGKRSGTNRKKIHTSMKRVGYSNDKGVISNDLC